MPKESRRLSDLINEIKVVFQVEGKESKVQKRLIMCRKKSILERGKCFSMGYANLSGPVAAARNSAGKKGEQKDERDYSGHVARKGRLCYAGLLAG